MEEQITETVLDLPATAESSEEVLSDTAIDETAPETPVDTPETVEESASADDESPDNAEIDESVGTTETRDELADLETSVIPSDSEIDKLRIPAPDKARLKEVARVATETSAKLESVGGDFGVKAFAPFAKVLSKPTATDNELAAAAGALLDANFKNTTALFTGAAQYILTTPQLADQLLPEVFGENATLENIEYLLKLDKAGYVDREHANAFLGEDYQFTDHFKQQEDTISSLQAQIEQLRSGKSAPDSPVPNSRPTQFNADAQSFTTDAGTVVPKALEQVFERVRWEKDGALAKIVTEIIQNRLKSDETYRNTETFFLQNGSYRNGTNRHPLAEANLHLLRNKSTALGIELIRALQNEMKQQSGQSRNTALAQKKTAVNTPTPVKMPAARQNETGEQMRDRLDREFKAQIAARRAAQQSTAV